jgi:hypothetical protein
MAQDLLLEPWPLRGARSSEDLRPTERALRGVTNPNTIDHNTDRIRAFAAGVREGKRMSLLGKLQHLTEDAEAFSKETSDDLDGIAAKIALAREKKATAKAKHHAYYDTIIKGVDESVAVIDRLSNGPLSGDGGN